MQAARITHLKRELNNRSPEELIEICLRMAKFKKENKELLTYLLFEAIDEEGFIRSVKSEIDRQFEEISTNRYYYVKKSVRKILRNVKKYIRYSKKKETEVELLLHFCRQLKNRQPRAFRYKVLNNMFFRQVDLIKKRIEKLHEDLQADYGMEVEDLLK